MLFGLVIGFYVGVWWLDLLDCFLGCVFSLFAVVRSCFVVMLCVMYLH